jgi:SH3-like domain-containing protein
MLKACSLAVLALSGTFLVPAAAAETATEQAAPAVASTTMAKKANVRFGPSLAAKVVVTLDAGAPVEVLGVAQGMPEWYVIRFPREGSAWVHEKVLQPAEGGKTAKVVEDRARVRDDARQGGNIVAELALGEVVEIKERARVGAWVPVYPPSAVAYVHKSVLNVPEAAAKTIEQKVEVDNRLDLVWDEVQARYGTYKAALDRDVEIAAKLDWERLDRQLGLVVDGHPSVRVQLAAKRLKDRIAPVVGAAMQVQRQNNIVPVLDVPGQPPVVIAKADPTPVQPRIDPLPATEPKPASEPAQPKIDPLPGKPTVGTDAIKDAATKAPASPSTGEFAAQGFLEERAVPAIGTNYVIIDKNGKVCALVKAKPGVDLQLSEFFWRLVGVKGDSQPVEPEKHGQGNAPIPLVLVDDVMLLSR